MTVLGEAATPFLAALIAVIRKRRSKRAYMPERIPDSILDACFDLAILAPTSHNLECWQMIDVRDTHRLAALRHLCLDQPAATTAPHLIVAVARPDLWRRGHALMQCVRLGAKRSSCRGICKFCNDAARSEGKRDSAFLA